MRLELRVVVLGLREAERWPTTLDGSCRPYKVAQHSKISGRPMGEQRCRKLLNELVEEGYATRRRSHSIGHLFRLTEKARTIR